VDQDWIGFGPMIAKNFADQDWIKLNFADRTGIGRTNLTVRSSLLYGSVEQIGDFGNPNPVQNFHLSNPVRS